jgi:tRNA A37 N6-isopentenylltransferase MiaA
VRSVEAAGVSRAARAALGYEELLSGDVESMKQRTRNLAKRQLAWMRRLEDVHRIDVSDGDVQSAASRIAHILAARPG